MKEEIHFSVGLEELNLILSALSQLQYIQVFSLIDKLQTQAKAQLLAAVLAAPDATSTPPTQDDLSD